MDTTDQNIIFDENGICDHCNTYYQKILPNWYKGNKGRVKLEKIINKIKKDGKGKDFDCIIGMSGGIDSSYLTYIAKENWILDLSFFMLMLDGILKLPLIILKCLSTN